MNKNNIISIYISFIIFSVVCMPNVSANGMPTVKGCCPELEERVKRLEDKVVEGSTKKMYLSGQVNRAIMWADDGRQSNTVHGDNDNSSSRIKLDGQAAYNDDFTVGFALALKITPNSTGAVQIHNARVAGSTATKSGSEDRIGVRQAEISFKSKKFGTLLAGHGTVGSYGTHFDTHLSDAFNFMEPYTMGGSLIFKNKNPAGASSNLLPAFVLNPGDGGNISGRAGRVRYDTPSYAGFSLRTSHGYQYKGDLWDVALRYAGEFSTWKFAANASFTRNETRETETGSVGASGDGVKFDNYAASVGTLAPFSYTMKKDTGIALRFSYTNRDYKQVTHKNGRSLRGVLSYKDFLCDWGMTTFEGSYGHFRNMTLDLNPFNVVIGKSWIFGVQQNIDKVGTELYLAYSNQKLEVKNSGQRYFDQDIILTGARIKF